MKYSYIFVKNELIEILNALGYVHFYTKEKADNFKEGRAFYYCIENKEYGYVDVVPNNEVVNIKNNEEYLKKMIGS